METDNKNLDVVDKLDDYSWFKVHYKSIKRSSKVLLYGVIKNFRRITWHSKKGLILEYVQVISVLIFMTLLCFLMFIFASNI